MTILMEFLVKIVILAVLAVAICILSRLYNYYNVSRRRVKLGSYKLCPTIKGLPILGNVHQFLKLSSPIKDIPPIVYTFYSSVGCMQCLDTENLGIMATSYALHNIVTVFKAETVEEVLSSNELIEKSIFYDLSMRSWLGNGLLLSRGKRWRKYRKMLTSAFHFKILERFQPVIYEKSEILLDVIRSKGSKFFSIENPIGQFTVDVICSTAMGIDLDCQKRVNDPYINSLKKITGLVMKRLIAPWLWSDTIFQWSQLGREYNSCLSIINNFVTSVIQERKGTLQKSDVFKNFDPEMSKGRLAFLDMLLIQHLSDENSLSEEDIRDEVNTFMFGGQDTTAVGLTFCLFLLGNYPEEQQKLYDEIQSVLGDDLDRVIESEDLKRMTYLDCVLKESQRIYPSVPFVGRHATEDFLLDGYLIKKGISLVVLTQALHKNPVQFPEPERFVPERFLPENSKTRHPFAYIPFSAGPRNCIGQKFALLEEKTVMANIIRHFKVISRDHLDKIPLVPELVSRPARDIFVKFIPRD